MKILLVNDDGYLCEGILTLARVLSSEHQVTVVAPDSERSGFSHAMSFGTFIKGERVEAPFPLYKLTGGTPCDCVKYGMLEVDPEFDCLIAGINTTTNEGTSCIYSGTVNAAAEGAIMGIPSIAVSANIGDGDYTYAATFILNNLSALLSMTGDEKFVSVNLPSGDRSEIKGVEMTRTGIIRFNDYYHHNESGSCLKGTLREVVNAYDSDVECLKRGCISVSILRISFDVTSAEPDKRLKLCW